MELYPFAFCLVLCSLSSAFHNFELNLLPAFSKCYGPTCQYGEYTGYGCVNGNCSYICADGFCNGFQAYRTILPPTSQSSLLSNWGYGATALKSACNGGDCGYWGGCKSGYCAGFYDFRSCGEDNCRSGSFRGFGCRGGDCQIICHGSGCSLKEGYGSKISLPKPPVPDLEDIGESFEKKDEWMLKDLTGSQVMAMVKSWLKEEKVFNEMKPDGKEMKFILNEFRKRNRMQKRLEIWRLMKRAELYGGVFCPHRKVPRPGCPFPVPRAPFGPSLPFGCMGCAPQACAECCRRCQQGCGLGCGTFPDRGSEDSDKDSDKGSDDDSGKDSDEDHRTEPVPPPPDFPPPPPPLPPPAQMLPAGFRGWGYDILPNRIWPFVRRIAGF